MPKKPQYTVGNKRTHKAVEEIAVQLSTIQHEVGKTGKPVSAQTYAEFHRALSDAYEALESLAYPLGRLYPQETN